MKTTEIKKIYSEMKSNGEKKKIVGDNEIAIFDFSLVFSIKNKEKNAECIITKNQTALKLDEVFNIWNVKNGEFKKKKMDFFYFAKDSSSQDIAFKNKTLTIGNVFNNYKSDEEFIDALYFCYPLFEKFAKIYLPFIVEKDDKSFITNNDYFNFIEVLYYLVFEESEEAAAYNIISNKSFKNLGFGKKEISFLKGLFNTFRYIPDPKFLKNISAKTLREIDNSIKLGLDVLEILQDVEVETSRRSQYYFIKKDFVDIEISSEKYGYINTKVIDLKETQFMQRSRIYNFFKLINFAHENNLSIYKMLEYIIDVPKEQFIEIDEVLSLYFDYLNMSKTLFDSYEKYPKRLMTMHDKVSSLFNESKATTSFDIEEKIIKKYENLKVLEGDLIDGYCIVTPKKAKDITNEGKKLSHCVGSYISSIAENNSTIVFVRKKDNIEKPLYTAEIKYGKVVQLRGFSNSSAPDEVKEALNKKIKEISNQKGA